MVVEDHGLTRMMLTGELGQLGEDVVTAANGAEALTILEHRDDIAVLVIGAVGPAGISADELGRIAAERWPQLRIVPDTQSGDLSTRVTTLMAALRN